MSWHHRKVLMVKCDQCARQAAFMTVRNSAGFEFEEARRQGWSIDRADAHGETKCGECKATA